jgi:hypothetical protein
MMPAVTRIEVFERAARKLRASFEELANVPHRGEKGSQAEEIVRRFLNEHLPRRFAAAGGFILAPEGPTLEADGVVAKNWFDQFTRPSSSGGEAHQRVEMRRPCPRPAVGPPV